MKKPLIPFGVLPGHWGLKGTIRDLAKAEYELSGKEREVAIANLTLKGKELELELNKLAHEYGEITLYEKVFNEININHEGEERELKILEHEHAHGKMTDLEYDRAVANVKKEPWVTIINVNYDPTTPDTGEMELDWNHYFIEQLENAGYSAPSEEETVDLWMNNLCRNIAMEAFTGVGDFDESISDGPVIKKHKLPNDGKYAAS